MCGGSAKNNLAGKTKGSYSYFFKSRQPVANRRIIVSLRSFAYSFVHLWWFFIARERIGFFIDMSNLQGSVGSLYRSKDSFVDPSAPSAHQDQEKSVKVSAEGRFAEGEGRFFLTIEKGGDIKNK